MKIEWEIKEKLQCIADPRKIRIIAETDTDLGGHLSYLASSKRGSVFSDKGVVSFKRGVSIVSIDAEGTIAITQLKDIDEAHLVLDEVVAWIGDVIARENEIDPEAYKKWQDLGILDILKRLPRTNCGKCGMPTCMAFAVELLEGRKDVDDCVSLKDPEYDHARTALKEMLGR